MCLQPTRCLVDALTASLGRLGQTRHVKVLNEVEDRNPKGKDVEISPTNPVPFGTPLQSVLLVEVPNKEGVHVDL